MRERSTCRALLCRDFQTILKEAHQISLDQVSRCSRLCQAASGAKDLQEIATLSKPDAEEDVEIIQLARQGRAHVQDITTEKERYLVVEAAERIAIPLSQVNCIVEPPQEITATDQRTGGFRGYFSRSDESIALFDLAVCRGRAPIESIPAKVVLTGQPGHQVGYMVSRVVSIEISEWCENPAEDQGKQSAALVQLGEGPNATVLPVCRLPDPISGNAGQIL